MSARLSTHLAALSALCAIAPAALAAKPPALVFPVVGGADYVSDFGAGRPQGSHQGNDLMADRGTPVVAAAAGVVKLHLSGRGGFMIYLRNARNEFLYIHLGRSGGRRAEAYARGLKTGMRVRAGQEIGYVGDSGDASGGATHLHFEIHNARGVALNPYKRLRAAPIPIISTPIGPKIARVLKITGTVGAVGADEQGATVTIDARSVLALGGVLREVERPIVLRLPPAQQAAVQALPAGSRVVVMTEPALVGVLRQIAAPGSWTLGSIAPS